MRALILGSRGLIGSAAAEAAADARYAVVRPSRDGQPALDLASDSSIDAFDFSGIDALIHAAGVTDEEVKGDPAGAIVRAGVSCSRLLDGAVAAGVRRFAYISSSHVYGPMVGRKSESSPVNPLGVYSLCHFAAEQNFRRAVEPSGGSLLICRPNAVFGVPPDIERFQRWSLIPFAFPRELVEHGRITLRSSGEQGRNFIGSSDIGRGVASWLSSDPEPGTVVWNPVGPLSCSVYAFAQRCVEVYQRTTGKKGQVLRPSTEPEPDRFELECTIPFPYAPDTLPDEAVQELIRRMEA